MKRIIILLSLLFLIQFSFVSAQTAKLRVAVLDPSISGKDFDEGLGVMIREMVSSELVNTGKYIIIERSLLYQILQEQKIGVSGMIDDSQSVQVGKLAGANKVVLSTLSSYGDKGSLSLKMIDVESGSVESQKIKVVKKSEILDITSSLALEVIGEKASPVASSSQKQDKEKGSAVAEGVGAAVGAGIGSLFGRSKSKDTPTVSPAPSKKDQFAERMNEEEGTNFSVSPNSQSGGESISLEFKGFSSGKNPNAEIYVDGVDVGVGTLNGGFSVQFFDSHPGKHDVKIEWSGTVDSKSYEINTRVHKRFVFEYVKTGFGYAFQLKK